MSPKTIKTIFAAAVLLFAAGIAPFCVLTAACSMPCCEGKSFPFVKSAAGCGEHCGIRSNPASQPLPDAVTPATAIVLIGVSATANDVAPASPPQRPALSMESRHAVPGDAPVYLYNSVFLI